MTYDPSNPPTAEEFLDPRRWPPEPDEPDYSNHYQAATESVAELEVRIKALEQQLAQIVIQRPITVYEAHGAADTAAEVARLMAVSGASDALPAYDGEQTMPVSTYDSLYQEFADLEAKAETVTQVISDVEAALGRSKAAPALAAKAVIEAWKNPTVPEPSIESMDNHVNHLPSGAECTDACPPALHEVEPEELTQEQQEMNAAPVAELGQIEGHTRAETEEGAPAICQECSYAAQDYVTWPCEGAAPSPQPAHDAPVEEWRAYARDLGFAGPEIDKANRSVIRTTLGIAHQ